ncbi:MAG TPA: FecR domain-containing protein [Opitutaceae bacterium]|jgi:transmembrane sensor|nr:FecR domain-containing protein [Opitutaceae bacterium]
MSPIPFPSPAAEEQAALWAARLEAGRLSRNDRSAFDLWLKSDPEHPRLLQQFQHLSAALDEQLPVLAAVGAVASPPPPATARPLRSRVYLGLAGAALAGAAVLAVALHLRPVELAYATGAGERHTLTLADGSRVELNANTTLRVTETSRERDARLLRGEAFFVVAKDPARPFVVSTPAGSVRVTGTVFDVRDEAAAQLEVTVVEGSVQVRPAAAAPGVPAYSLGAGDHYSAAQPGVSRLSASAVEDLLAWRQGTVIFDGTRLADALASFARFTGQSAMADPAVANLKISGRFQLDQFDEFLAGLPVRWPVQVDRDDHGVIHVTARAR